MGGEALVRWKHPKKGMIPPFEFIGVFEKNGFIIRLDYFVWEETCKLLAKLKKEGYGGYPISINVSRAHFYGTVMVDLPSQSHSHGSSDDFFLDGSCIFCHNDSPFLSHYCII